MKNHIFKYYFVTLYFNPVILVPIKRHIIKTMNNNLKIIEIRLFYYIHFGRYRIIR